MKRSQRLLLKLWTSESEIPRRREQVFLERRTRVVYRTTIFFFPPLWISNGIFRTMSNRVEKVVYWLRPKLSTDLQRNISCTINTVTKLLLLENRSSVWPWCTTTSLLLKVKRRKFRKDLRKSILHVEKDSDSFLFSATKHIYVYMYDTSTNDGVDIRLLFGLLGNETLRWNLNDVWTLDKQQ